ncbi:MAG: hypothetical protein JXQ65_02520 [Candidatus Marinimicrobia bacterium]|nr:hypothetical protein [Candidatus Neomarinimicrobiota bacterium]
MARKRVSVIKVDDNGRNQEFKDNFKNKTMNRNEFVNEIKKGNYPHYHIRTINHVETPVSNPDKRKSNNLD